MGKRAPSPDQLGFVFDPPEPASTPAALAGLEAQICRAVSDILHDDPRTREEIAAKISELLDEDVTKGMLDAYASPRREEHRVPFSRFQALVAVTGRHDLLDRVLRPIGAAVLVGEEVHTARVGHLRQKIALMTAELRAAERVAPLIGGKRGS